ncbi:MAG: protein kinase [Phycisphaerales bacterium]|nr:protein kinase [Phycisphaerae bacterium]NNF43528.1 protein kinase [Phycisphaerales bacterium]NNM24795.1 protein kinase [Phycisphaerales bacterium]
MSGDQTYHRAKQIFLTVCDLPEEQRGTALDEKCGGDTALRSEVEALLFHHVATIESTDADGSMNAAPSSLVTQVASPTDDGEHDIKQIGAYRILHEVGRGGMGVVYLAVREDERFTRRVAIKLLKRGMDTEDVLRRFELERQMLAAMNHAGIARLYDAGETENGLPYFVMEYIEGREIEAYCDAHRLRIEERLELFRRVCDAVQHAHQNLVVHRDIKPSNVIVTEDGQPKLLDFGIAKVINPEFAMMGGDPTAPEYRVMTPEYASPEQVRGDPITTASDVYSLGVLLYELLSGHAPYRLRSRVRAELERVICHQDPERPSTAISRVEELDTGYATTKITPESVSESREERPERLRRRLSGDIDNIIMMAMRKEPQRRYRSAEQFSEDIRRHMHGLTVKARPDTMGYRVSKFVGRHRLGVAAVVAIGLLLVAGVVGTSWGWNRAVQAEQNERDAKEIAVEQRDLADDRLQQTIDLARTFMYDFHDAIVQLDGALPARQLLLTKAHEYLAGLQQEVAHDPDLERLLAAAYERVGDIEGGNRNPSLGGAANAMENYRAALALRQKIAAADPGDAETQRDLSRVHISIGDMLALTGDLAGAMQSYQTALDIRTTIAANAASDPVARRDLAIALLNVGKLHVKMGTPAEAIPLYERSLAIRKELAAEAPDDTRAQRDLALAHMYMGGRRADVADVDGALAEYEAARGIRETLVETNPDSGRWRRDLAMTHFFIAATYLQREDPKGALPHLEHYFTTTRQRATDNPTSARAQRDLALAHDLLGQTHQRLGEADRALEHFRAFEATITPLAAAHPEQTTYQALRATAHERMAELRAADEAWGGAIEEARKALAIMEGLVDADPDSADRKHELARISTGIGHWLIQNGQRGEGLQRLEAGRDLYRSLRAGQPDDPGLQQGLLVGLHYLTELMLSLEDAPAALGYAQEARAVTADAAPRTLHDLARAQHLSGARDDAIANARAALAKLADATDDASVALREQIEADLARFEQP